MNLNIRQIKKNNENISKFIFNLRNLKYVRQNSINKKKITLKSHELWLKKFFKKKDKLFVIFDNKIPLGYIRLEYDRKIYKASWAITKKYQKKKIAQRSLQYVTKIKRYKYKAIIRSDNIASVKVAKKAKFKLKIVKNNIFYLYKN